MAERQGTWARLFTWLDSVLPEERRWLAPSSREPRSPGAWFLARLDFLLSETQRRSPPEQLGRFRVLMGSTLFFMALSGLLLLGSPLLSDGSTMFLIGLGSWLGLVLVFVLSRRSTSPRPPALLLCFFLVGAYMGCTFALRRADVAAHSTTMLIPTLAVYLVGVRTGLLFTGLFCLNAGVLLPLYLTDFGTRSPLFAQPGTWVAGLINSFILLLGWGLSALFSTARDAANATVRESGRKLHSLVESTDDLVCSLDAQGRLLTLNSAGKRVFVELFGREARPGDVLDERSTDERRAEWRGHLSQAFQGQSVRYEVALRAGSRTLVLDLAISPIPGDDGRPVGVTLFGRDVTARKVSEAKLSELHRSLLEVSRQAGMAEVATGVLHNVGNTLNSVNVSASLVMERLRGSRAPLLARAVELLREHEADLSAFFTGDTRGRQLPAYLSSASQHLVKEQAELLEELQGLIRNVEHIRAVVAMQQENARIGGVVERVPVPELLDDALRLHAGSFERLGIQLRREYAEVPLLWVDRHKLLQILVNLLSNARHALVESGRDDKLLTLRVSERERRWLCIEVCDNGVGITPENLPRLFVHGFTTKKDGHGFGLHASAVAAEEMKGRLLCSSAGPGQGATFIIELPLEGEESRA